MNPMECDDIKSLDTEKAPEFFTVICGDAKTEFQVLKRQLNISRVFVSACESDKSATSIEWVKVEPGVFAAILPYLAHCDGKEAEEIKPPAKSTDMKENDHQY